MDDAGAFSVLDQDPWTMPLERIDLIHADIFRHDRQWDYFARLRRDAPVHWTAESAFGPFWSITRHADIMAVDTDHALFSSEGGIIIADQPDDFTLPMFIAMDPPKHDRQRKTVQPIVASEALARLEPLIRERAGAILDALPRDTPFDWVDRVSVELTTQMLATLFDFPWEDRRKLTRWSDVATARPGYGIVESEEQRKAELMECAACFMRLRDARAEAPPAADLISMLAHGESTRDMPTLEFLGNLLLLIVGGNDTTRNSITGGLWALSQNPEEERKLRADPSLIPNMVSEIIRWQTPLAYMRRRATADVEMHGRTIRRGDKVVMWYASGNRDERAIDQPDRFWIDRPHARRHLSFGFGIHRCLGARLAEMQLRVVWEEVLKRFPVIEVVGEPLRVPSAFVCGYERMTVCIPA